MKPEEQIIFTAELLDIINALQELVSDHCRAMAAEWERTMQENTPEYDDNPF